MGWTILPRMKLEMVLFATLPLALIACGGASSESGSGTTPGAEAQYEIVIHRPVAAGQRFRVEVEAHEIVQAFETAENPEEMVIEGFTENTQVAFAATIEIVEVDDEGRAARAEVEVERFAIPSSGEEIVPAGTRMVAGWEGETLRVEVDGEDIGEEGMELLELAFPLERPGSALGDELFGATTPKAVGDVWELRKDIVADDLGEDGYTAAETNLTGQTELVGTNACGDTECIVLEATIRAEQVAIAEEWQLVDFEAGELEAVVRLQLPMDTNLPAVSEEATTVGRFIIQIQEGDETRETLASISRMRNATYRLLD